MERALKKHLKDGRFIKTTPARSRMMSKVRGKNNKSTEVKFRMAIVRGGIMGWTANEKTIIGKPDFYFKKARLAVFVDGCFWHGCPKCGHIPKSNTSFWKEKVRRNKARDKKTKRALLRQGIHVARLWEHQIRDAKAVGAMVKEIQGRI